MLVLKRSRDKKIFIDGGVITLTLVDAGVGWAKIGFDAPERVRILRDDLCPDGPSRCCRCGGTLPPAEPCGVRVAASTLCQGQPDPGSGRCPEFVASTLWGDIAIGPERKDGGA